MLELFDEWECSLFCFLFGLQVQNESD